MSEHKLDGVVLKDCTVVLQRFDDRGCLANTSTPSAVPSNGDLSRPDAQASSEIKDCRVLLSRCDEIGRRGRSRERDQSCSDGPLTPCKTSRECIVLLSRCDVAVTHHVKQCEQKAQKKKGVTFKIPSSDQLTPHSVILKPGKQWRRSLSILSKLKGHAKGRNSSSESDFQGQYAEKPSVWVDGRVSRRSKLESNSQAEPEQSSPIFKICGQIGPVPFGSLYPESMRKKCRKLGEGVYGEVFAYSGKRGKKSCVIKIVPIEGPMEVNGEPQKTFGEILSEVCVARELGNLRSGLVTNARTFNEVQAIRCVQGRYPDWLVGLWCDYRNSKGSQNDSPEIFQEDQLYIVEELSYGGQELEKFTFNSAVQALSVLKQVALALAVGERALSFEHRDLHWGNVLISNTRDKEIQFMLDGEPISLPSEGVQVSIIDFTMSRITDPSTNQSIYYDLAKDETLFTAHGDYQFEIYRMMKNYCENQWEVFSPKTNVAWLHYLSDKLCTMARYHNRKSVAHMNAIESLVEIKESLLSFPSAKCFVRSYILSQ